MYDKETVERYLRARERGARLADAAGIAGVSTMTAKYWSAGRLPHSCTGAPRKASRRIDWSGVGAGEFMARLDAYLEYYCEGRIERSLGWLSPNEYRRSLGYDA